MEKKKKPSQQEIEKYHDKTYFVLAKSENEHLVDYVIHTYIRENGFLVEMLAADNGLWASGFAGTMVASVTDTGNGYKWNVLPMLDKEHDYTDGYIMMILFAFLNNNLSKPTQYEIVETRQIIGTEVK